MLKSLSGLACLLTMGFLVAPSAVLALEGGYPSSHRDWQSPPTMHRPDPAARTLEKRARTEAMQADIARLQARLRTAPDSATLTRLHARLEEIRKNYGWVPELKMVWGTRDIQGILENQGEVPAGLLRAFVQLKNDLAARDIDLVLMPFPPTPHFQAHLVAPGIRPDQDYTPGWTRMLIQMLEHDLEVIDPLDAYRREANQPVVINWPNDFHTASLGRQIAARQLAERLQRYDFARELAPHRKLWTGSEATATNAGWPQRITTVNGMFEQVAKSQIPAGAPSWPVRHPSRANVLRAGAPNLETELTQRTFGYLNLKRNFGNLGVKDLARLDLVMIGDSQLHSAVHGSGLPEFIMAEVGGLFRWGSKSWSGFSPPDIYREVVPDKAPQPRVVVLACLVKYFWEGDDKYAPRPLPALARADEPAAPAGLPDARFQARVRVTGISAQRDPEFLEYDHAITHTAGVVVGGPHDGKPVGVRYWTMRNRELVKNAGIVRPGHVLNLSLQPWDQAIAADGTLAEHCIYNDTDQADQLDIPVYWVAEGPLGPAAAPAQVPARP